MLDHIRYLTETIGPRPTGTPAETNALAYCERQLQTLGYSTQRQPVYRIKRPSYPFWSVLITVSLMTAGILMLETFPWLLIAVMLFNTLVLMPYYAKSGQKPDRRGLDSFNLSAEQPASDPYATLIIGAHVDSGLISRPNPQGLWRVVRRVVDFSYTIFVVVGLLGLWLLQALVGSHAIIDGLRWLLKGYVVVCWLYTVSQAVRRRFSKPHYGVGANDNASGVGLALGLAEHVAAHPLHHLNIRFVFFCANESLLAGSRHYVATLSATTRQVYMLNLDMVGIGDKLCFVPTRHHARLNTVMEQSGAVSRANVQGVNTDSRSFEKAQIPSVWVYAGGDAQARLVQRTPSDTVEQIGPAMLSIAQRTLVQFMEQLDNNVSPS